MLWHDLVCLGAVVTRCKGATSGRSPLPHDEHSALRSVITPYVACVWSCSPSFRSDTPCPQYRT
jgi:hypothetical protein